MTDAVFARDGALLIPTDRAAGPWDPGLLHGGAPSCVLAWAAETYPTEAPMRLTRLTVDLMRPAPIAPLTIRTEVTRAGRNIQVLALSIEAHGKEVVRASALKVRDLATDVPGDVSGPPVEAPAPETCEPFTNFGDRGFGANFDKRIARGRRGEPGPTAVWFRPMRALIEGVETSPAMRAAAVADFGNGVSGVLDFTKWTYINADLTVNFARAPEGDWVLLDAETWAGRDGRGFAASRLGDAGGYFGRGLQNLVIAPR